MAESRRKPREEKAPGLQVVTLKPNIISQRILSAMKKKIPAEKIRCIIAECKYNEKYELDEFTLAEIRGAVSDGYKCQIFIATQDKDHFSKCVEANKITLEEIGGQIEIANNIDYYETSHYIDISKRITQYYQANPAKKAEFDAKVLDGAKEYLARAQRKLEGLSERTITHNDLKLLKERAWREAGEEKRAASIKHVSSEAMMVVSWAIQNPDLVTVVLSQDFTSAMGIAVGHAPEMNIGYNKDAVILMPSEKKVSPKTPFARAVTKEVDEVFAPEVKAMMMAYVDNKDPDTALAFFDGLNKLVQEKRKASPTSTPSSISPNDEMPASTALAERSPANVSSTLFHHSEAKVVQLKHAAQPELNSDESAATVPTNG